MSHPLAWNTDNLFHVRTSVGAARFAVYSFKDIFKFSGTFLGKIYYKRGILSGCTAAAQAMPCSAFCSKVERAETAKPIVSRGG